MGILRTDRVSGLGGANAIKGSVFFSGDGSGGTAKGTSLNIVDANDKADLNFAGNDFTFEAWVFPKKGVQWNLVYGQSWGLQIYIDTSSTGFVKVYVGSNDTGSYAISGAQSANGTINADAWNHIAFSRSGNSWTIFTNGTAATSSTSSQSLVSSNADYTIGIFNSIGSGNDAGSYFGFVGYISNLRIRTGAHYLPSTNFTPPVGELQKTSDTVLLACQSPGDITKEATGKTLVPTRKNLNDALPQASHFTPNSPVGFSTTTDVGTQFGTTFDGVTTFDSQSYFVPPGGNARERNRGVGLYAGGTTPSTDPTAQIASILIQSLGNSTDFGDLSVARYPGGTGASFTRGIWAGGATPTRLNTIDFVTIATTGNATDFGDTQNVVGASAGVSNSTRMVNAGGDNPSPTLASVNVMDLIIIATAGNGSDFGDLSVARATHGAAASPTRGLFAGGWTVVPAYTSSDTIDFVTIATTGNAQDFGNLTTGRRSVSGGSSQTRAIFMGGKSGSNPSSTKTNIIDFVTIASTGDATDFGDLTATVRDSGNTMSNSIRACKAAGYNSPATVNNIDMVTIATRGDAVDFGDTVIPVFSLTGLSDSHGGLS